MHARHTGCESCPAREGAICGPLSQEQRALLYSIAHSRHFRAGEVVVGEAEAASSFAIVTSGVVKLVKTMADGRQQIVGLLFPSDFLGRPFSACSPCGAEAATELTLCTFPRDRLEQLLTRMPCLEHGLYAHALCELDMAQEWMLLLGRKSAAEKMAGFLLMAAKRSRNPGVADEVAANAIRFELPLTRSDVADFLGLRIETVSRQITRLKELGIITREDGPRVIVVRDLARLKREAEQCSDA